MALRRAAARIGTPYAYGGGGPGGPGRGFCDDGNGFLRGRCAASSTVGFDCSSLVQYAYWPRTQLPRTAAAQYEATAHRPVARGELRPGDLLFWARRNGFICHVGFYAGDGRVLHAPRTGRNVEVVVPLDTAMPATEYRGATRAWRVCRFPLDLAISHRSGFNVSGCKNWKILRDCLQETASTTPSSRRHHAQPRHGTVKQQVRHHSDLPDPGLLQHPSRPALGSDHVGA
nr:NlpC/P60 family protein [Streptomyces sp. DSM 41633]